MVPKNRHSFHRQMKDMQMFSSIRMLLAFVMIPLLQKELDTFKDTVWNTHRIRQQKDTVLPHGIPEHIYNFPSEYGLEESGRLQKFLFPVFLPIHLKHRLLHLKGF